MKLYIFLVFAVLLPAYKGCEDKIRACYFTNWAQYRPPPMTFLPEDIDVSLCTHVVYAFANMNGNQLVPYESNDDELYQGMIALKEQNPDMKILLAVGGWTFLMPKLTVMLSSLENRTEFITTSIQYIRNIQFDGLDLDFEYPGNRGSIPEDKFLYTILVEELRAAFDAESIETGLEALLLTTAVPCGKEFIDEGYEIDKLAPLFDWVAPMSYDYNGPWDNRTGHMAPRTTNDIEAPEFYQNRNVEWCVNYWEAGGTPRDKLVVGIPTYGRGFTLLSSFETDMYSPVIGTSAAMPFTRDGGVLSYYEVCTEVIDAGATTVWTEEYDYRYAYLDDQWFSYEDMESAAIKINWIKNSDYAGYMVWAYDFDDFNGLMCEQGTYPMMSMMRDLYCSTEENFCFDVPDGLFTSPGDCTKYIQCTSGMSIPITCADGKYFNPDSQLCDLPEDLSEERRAECGLLTGV